MPVAHVLMPVAHELKSGADGLDPMGVYQHSH